MAVLVILINGYLLLEFFVSEVKGLLFGFMVGTGTVAYVAFIVYLVSRGGTLSSSWLSLELSKRIAFTRN